MTRLACNLPHILTGGIPLLKQHTSCSVSLSQLQIASLLANAFFCTFPSRNTLKQNAEYSNYPDINFNRLFGCGRGDKEPSVQEKLKCIMNYFRRVVQNPPIGVVTFSRYHVVKEGLPSWAESQAKLPRLHISSEGTIEDEGQGMLQVDFANKLVGGGVLSLGCVQEEIRFVICPELIISRLFTECLDDTEALIITGCEQYNRYTGYADSFSWDGDHIDTTPIDEFGRRYCTVVALDAIYYARNPSSQFSVVHLQRELNKAFIGFSYGPPTCSVATGNWGCGVFCGNAELKAILQVMAAGYTGRDLAYFTFKDEKLRDSVYRMYKYLCDMSVTVGKLYKLLCKFSDHRSSNKNASLYSFLYSALSPTSQNNVQSKLTFSARSATTERKAEKACSSNQETSAYLKSSTSSTTNKNPGLSNNEIDSLLGGLDENILCQQPSSPTLTSSQIIVDDSTNGTITNSQIIIEDSDQESKVNFKEVKTYHLSEEKDRKVCFEKVRNSWMHIDFGEVSKDSSNVGRVSELETKMESSSNEKEESSFLNLVNTKEKGNVVSDTVKKCSARIDKVQLNSGENKRSSSHCSSKNSNDKVTTGVKRKISDYFLPA